MRIAASVVCVITGSCKKLVFAPILRAGVGFLDGMLNLVPSARVAHIGLYRDPQTLEAVEYYFKAPTDVAERLVIVMDPMLATANSAVAAIDKLKGRGVRDIRFVCLLAAPEGVARLSKAHPDVQIWTAAIEQAHAGIAAQHEALVALGCDALQGFFIAHPMTAVDLGTWLREHRYVGREA